MANYLPTISTTAPETLDNLQPGQWIEYNGVKGRYMGRRNGSVWIAWGATARKRFGAFADAYKRERHPLRVKVEEIHVEDETPAQAGTLEYVLLAFAFILCLFALAFSAGVIGDGATTLSELGASIVPDWIAQRI